MADDFDEGWGDLDDDLIDDDNDLAAPGASTRPSAAVGQAEEGWGDDDLDGLDEDPTTTPPKATQPVATASEEMGWGDDDDLDLSDDGDDTKETTTGTKQQLHVQTTPAPSRQRSNPQIEEVFHELEAYVESLMILLPSINAVLQAEYNLPEKAQELLHYYHERPQLREYTIEKELSRMDYKVMLQHSTGEEPTMVDNKQEIAQLFKLQNELDLLVRCANQSLLADLLQVMTKPDGLVRPQYMATCLADSCLFVITTSPGIAGGLVECTSELVLSLPEPSGDRYPVATIKVHILLGVPTDPRGAPMIEYKLQSMDIIIPSMDVLRPTAQFLVESGLVEHPPMSPFPETPGGPIDDIDTFRDVFLQQSQNMLQNSTVGLKSAWKQIDSVAGFSTKMNMVQKILPTADGSVLEAAMQEQEAYQRQLQQQQQQQMGAPPPGPASDEVPVSYPPQARPPPIPQARPTSILGSFMGAIAKSVTLPEEDPSMYAQYNNQSNNQRGPPQPQGAFPRPPGGSTTTSPAVQLYRKEDSPAQPPAPSISQTFPLSQPQPPAKKTSPWLSRMTKPDAASAPPPPQPTINMPAPPPAVPAPMTVQAQPSPTVDKPQEDEEEDLGLDDGWGEDEDLALDAEEEQESKSSSSSSSSDGSKGGEKEDVRRGAPPTVITKANPPPVVAVPPLRVVEARKPATPAKTTPAKGFSPEDDIIPTRKRWVNPRPGPRFLRPLVK